MTMTRVSSIPMILFLCLGGVLGGCQSTGPKALEIPANRYDTAFDAAREAARQVGMPALLADRTGGIIESRPRLAGSVMEPWRVDNTGSQWISSSLHKQRRRVEERSCNADCAQCQVGRVCQCVGHWGVVT